jgi:hypothetical protein
MPKRDMLEGWARKVPGLRAWKTAIGAEPWKEAFVFFKHEDEGAALGSSLVSAFVGGWVWRV